jgi:hypothetical protein
MTHLRVADVLRLAADQYDLVTTAQLRRLGIDRSCASRLVAAGVLEPFGGPGIRRIAGGEPSTHQRLLAAAWAAGPDGVVSHRCAAWLWALDGIEEPAPEVSVPRDVATRRPTGVRLHHSSVLARALTTTLDGIPVTEPTRTLIDLAGVVDAEVLELAFDSALRQGLTSFGRATSMLERLARPGRNGIGPFRALVESRAATDGVTESMFEARLVQVLRRGGLPERERQVEVYDRDGFIGRFDCAYPPALVAIEADSVRFHHARQRFEADRKRRTRAEAVGWRVPTVTWRQLTREPRWVVRTTMDLLAAAGWDWRAAPGRSRAERGVAPRR